MSQLNLYTPPSGWGKRLSYRVTYPAKTPSGNHAALVMYQALEKYGLGATDVMNLALECLGVVNGWIDAHETLEFAQLKRQDSDMSPEELIAARIIDYLRANSLNEFKFAEQTKVGKIEIVETPFD